jgi:redox-sensitive bicupin YhaK (pirin superfamily)
MIAILAGQVTVDGKVVREAEIARLSSEGEGARVQTDGDSILLVMTGEPIDEPVVGYGPFVMNTEDEIRQAIDDFNSGRFARVAENA